MKYLALLLLLCASVARADGIDNFDYGGGYFDSDITFSLPPTLQVPKVPAGAPWEFPTNINYLGGVLSGAFAFYDPPNPTEAVIELGYIVSVPPGFVDDPNISFYQQWPYDYQHIAPLLCCDGSALFTRNGDTLTFVPGVHGLMTITTTTPEPSTIILLGLAAAFFGAALSFGRKERRQAVV